MPFEIDTSTSARNKAKVIQAVKAPLLRGTDDAQQAYADIEEFARTAASRIERLEQMLTQSGAGGVQATTLSGDPALHGIIPGRIVHVRDDGIAELAVNSDADLYATHVVTNVAANGQMTCYGFGHWPVCCLPFANAGDAGPLWLSDLPGHATDTQPDADTTVNQRIGERMSQIDKGSGVCFCVFKPEMFPTGTGPSGPFAPIKDGSGIAQEDIAIYAPLHVDGYGLVWLADASNMWRFMTHYAMAAASEGDSVDYASAGTVDFPSDADLHEEHTNALYLSTNAGKVTVNPPDGGLGDAGWKIRQLVGWEIEDRDATALTIRATVNISDWVYV